MSLPNRSYPIRPIKTAPTGSDINRHDPLILLGIGVKSEETASGKSGGTLNVRF